MVDVKPLRIGSNEAQLCKRIAKAIRHYRADGHKVDTLVVNKEIMNKLCDHLNVKRSYSMKVLGTILVDEILKRY